MLPSPLQKQRLRGLVWQPLCSLTRALAGPQNLIKKRLDKLLDFDRVEEKLLDVGSVTYEEEAARHEYQALNSLLVAELPQFNQLVMQWLGQILCTFVVLQRDLADQVLRRAESSMALVRLLGLRLLWSTARQGPRCIKAKMGIPWTKWASGTQDSAGTLEISLMPFLLLLWRQRPGWTLGHSRSPWDLGAEEVTLEKQQQTLPVGG